MKAFADMRSVIDIFAAPEKTYPERLANLVCFSLFMDRSQQATHLAIQRGTGRVCAEFPTPQIWSVVGKRSHSANLEVCVFHCGNAGNIAMR